MAFKYINPGIADLFDEASPNCYQYYNSAYSRTSGDCFQLCEDINTLYLEKSNEYWVAFYYYPILSNGGGIPLFRFANSLYAIVLTHYYINDKNFYLQFENGSNVIFGTKIDKTFYYNKGYHIEVYVKDDATNGVIKMWLDGELVFEFNGKTGNGDGLNKAIFSASRKLESYLSDIVIQNIGRIGDKRIAKLCYNNLSSDFEYYDVPVGNEWNMKYERYRDNDRITVNKSFVFTDIPFKADGKVKEVTVFHHDKIPYGGNTSLATSLYKFFILRKNDNNKLDVIYSNNEYIITTDAENGIHTFVLSVPLDVQKGDYFGYFIKNNNGNNDSHTIYTVPNNNCMYYTDDITQTKTIDLSTFTRNDSTPCMWFLFETNDNNVALQHIIENDNLNRTINKFVGATTNSPNKVFIRNVLKGDLKIGKIDSIAVSCNAHYEGETIKGLSAIIKSGENIIEGERIGITTENKNKILSIYEKNPVTNNAWAVDDLKNLMVGIKSKE